MARFTMKGDLGGDYVKGATCPLKKCGRATIRYNGNYWCSSCGWVMPERATAKNKVIVKRYLVQLREQAVATRNEEEVQRLDMYLSDYEDVTI
jgi:uncharacterized Zn finger protein (UPF0148 family)